MSHHTSIYPSRRHPHRSQRRQLTAKAHRTLIFDFLRPIMPDCALFRLSPSPSQVDRAAPPLATVPSPSSALSIPSQTGSLCESILMRGTGWRTSSSSNPRQGWASVSSLTLRTTQWATNGQLRTPTTFCSASSPYIHNSLIGISTSLAKAMQVRTESLTTLCRIFCRRHV